MKHLSLSVRVCACNMITNQLSPSKWITPVFQLFTSIQQQQQQQQQNLLSESHPFHAFKKIIFRYRSPWLVKTVPAHLAGDPPMGGPGSQQGHGVNPQHEPPPPPPPQPFPPSHYGLGMSISCLWAMAGGGRVKRRWLALFSDNIFVKTVDRLPKKSHV